MSLWSSTNGRALLRARGLRVRRLLVTRARGQCGRELSMGGRASAPARSRPVGIEAFSLFSNARARARPIAVAGRRAARAAGPTRPGVHGASGPTGPAGPAGLAGAAARPARRALFTEQGRAPTRPPCGGLCLQQAVARYLAGTHRCTARQGRSPLLARGLVRWLPAAAQRNTTSWLHAA